MGARIVFVKKRRDQNRKLDAIEVKIGGEGVGLESVPIRALAELLQAAASAVETVAKASGMEAPAMHLIEVREGSAAYTLASESTQAAAVIGDLYDTAKLRGKGAQPEVRHALKRLHGEAAKYGSLRIRTPPSRSGRARKEITVAPPIDDQAPGHESYEDVYGRVVGLYAARDSTIVIHIRIEEGRTEAFSADESLVGAATAMFNKYVMARVVYAYDVDTKEPLTVESIVAWERAAGDFAFAADKFRSDLQEEGIEIDASEWLAELHSDA